MDVGTLRDAIKRGVFHRRVSQTAMAVDLTGCIKVGGGREEQGGGGRGRGGVTDRHGGEYEGMHARGGQRVGCEVMGYEHRDALPLEF